MANKTTPNNQPLYLKFAEDRSHGYFHINVSVVTDRWDSPPNGVPTKYPYGTRDAWDDPLVFSGLRIACQGDEQSRVHADRQEPVYGFTVSYNDLGRIELPALKKMTRTIEKIDKGLSKLSEARGYSRSFGEYVGRVAEVLRVEGFVCQNTVAGEEMTGNRWRWMSTGDGVNAINHAIYQWQRQATEVK